MGRVLLIEDDDAMRLSLVQTLELEEYTVVSASGLEQARRSIRINFPGVILTDIRMPRFDGFDVLARCQEVDPDLPVIFLTGEADVPMAVDALKKGVFDFLEKPCSTDQLLKVIGQATKQREATLRSRKLQRKIEQGDLVAQHFPGVSQASELIRSELRALQTSRSHIHIFGEKGAGRKLSVECLAQAQPDLKNTFLQCGEAVKEWPNIDKNQKMNVFAFGISSATRAQVKKLETLVIRSSQIRLITVDQMDMLTIKNSSDLSHLFDKATFQELSVPDLEDRRIDLGIIFESLLQKAARDMGVTSQPLDGEFLETLKSRKWPRNLYSLEEVARGKLLNTKPISTQNFQHLMSSFERTVLANTLSENSGNVERTAQALQLPKKTLYDKLSKHSLAAKEFKPSTSE